MKKVRYEIDPYNRLVLDNSGDRSNALPKFRKVLDGRFRIGEGNELSYLVKAPLSGTEDIPNQLQLKGRFSLTDDHDLCLTLDKQYREMFGDRLVLEGEIADVDANSLLFAVTTKTESGTFTYALNIEGVWKADENNRLSFYIKKEKGRYDILTFNGVWEIDKNYRIIYCYEKTGLIRKKTRTHTLTFEGRWDIKEKFRISYMLAGDTDSAFTFRSGFGIFKKDLIRYEVGITLSGRLRPAVRKIALWGRWNLRRGVGLVFEIGYAGRDKRPIVFGADARLSHGDTVSFKLTSADGGNDMGAELELSRKILEGSGEAFLRILKSKQESAVYAGAAWRW